MASEVIFSELPDDLLSEILCSLSLRQRATASLVSRKWHRIITSLDDSKFLRKPSAKRYCVHCNCYPYFGHHKFCGKCINIGAVIKLAADNTTLTELYLLVPFSLAFFLLLDAVFESRLLTVLHLKNCTTKENDISGLPCLKEICFEYVIISGTTLSKLISECPSIVELTLIRCFNMNSISVPHQNQLKKVLLNFDDVYLPPIEIKARNLTEFHLFASNHFFASKKSLKVDLCACTKLQVLELDCPYIPTEFPEDISLEFPHLKSLSLRSCKKLKTIKLLSRELENLFLSDMLDLDDAIIDTPNLRSFKLLNMKKVPSLCLVIGSKLMEVEIGLKNAPTTKSLLQLRTFAEHLGEIIVLSFDITELKEVISHSENLQSHIEPLCIKHITLEVLSSVIPGYESFIDELFNYFHPRTLLVRGNSDALNCTFIQVLLDELKGHKTNCSKHCDYMCWRYALKSFEILESTTTTKPGAHQISLEFHWHLPYNGQSLDCSQ